MKRIKKMLALFVMLCAIVSSVFVFTGCKKKDNGSTTSTKTTQKEKTFEDYWIFVENDNFTSEKAYNNITLTSKEKGKNNLSEEVKNYGCRLKAKEDIKIKSISYTFTNDSTVSTQIYSCPNNASYYDKDNQITYLMLKGNDYNDYLTDIDSGESVNKTISYDNLIIKKGEVLYITAPHKPSTNNENWFFYNFKINFEEVK